MLEVQRSVVVEEFKETVLNRPYGRVMHELRDMLYSPAHPYSWPVIGLEPAHIERVTDADVRSWFYSHYAPNNAVLSCAGNVEPERLALERAVEVGFVCRAAEHQVLEQVRHAGEFARFVARTVSPAPCTTPCPSRCCSWRGPWPAMLSPATPKPT